VDPDPLNAEQSAWLTNFIQQFHDGLHAEPMLDYAAVIDVPSFIDHMVICELTKNVDAYVRSSYYHKDRDGLLEAGPLWDYNFALGGVGAQDAAPDPQDEDDTGWMYLGARNVNNWYPRLSTDPTFMAQFRSRYLELHEGLLSDAAIQQRVDALLAPLQEAAVRDFERWPVGDIITSDTGFTGGPTVATWDGQVQVMRDFLSQRLAWIDQNLP
jgi:spore coat protein CotH